MSEVMNYTKHLNITGVLCLLGATAMLPWKTLSLPHAQQHERDSKFENDLALAENSLATSLVPTPPEISPQTFAFGKWEPATQLDLPDLPILEGELPLPEREHGHVLWAESGFLKLMPPTATTMVFCTDEGSISLNLRTGGVEIPKGAKLPKAAVAFWKAVARAFPEARQIIIAEDGQFGGPAYPPSIN